MKRQGSTEILRKSIELRKSSVLTSPKRLKSSSSRKSVTALQSPRYEAEKQIDRLTNSPLDLLLKHNLANLPSPPRVSKNKEFLHFEKEAKDESLAGQTFELSDSFSVNLSQTINSQDFNPECIMTPDTSETVNKEKSNVSKLKRRHSEELSFQLNKLRAEMTQHYEGLLGEQALQHQQAFKEIYENQAKEMSGLRSQIYSEYLAERTSLMTNMEKMYQGVIETIRKDYELVADEKNREIGRLQDERATQQARFKELERTVTEQDNVIVQMETLIDKSPVEPSLDFSRLTTSPDSDTSAIDISGQDGMVREQAAQIHKLQKALAWERGKSGKLEEKLTSMNN